MAEMSRELKKIEQMALKRRFWLNMVYIHWTAGHYDQCFDDYHICINKDGSLEIMCRDLEELKYHTWSRNYRGIGIALTCAYNARLFADGSVDLGPEPPTREQVDSAAQVMAVLSENLGIPLTDVHFLTHCEAAEKDGYGPSTTCERWDLYKLQDFPGSEWLPGGQVLRGKAVWWHNVFYGR